MSTSGGSSGGTQQVPMPSTGDPRALGSAVGVGSANRAIYSRVNGSGTVSGVRANFAVSSGHISVGFYSGTGTGTSAAAGARLQTSGSVACPAIGTATVALGGSVTVDSSCWFGISADNATATVSATTAANSNPLEAGWAGYQATAHPLPATATMTEADGNVNVSQVLVGV